MHCLLALALVPLVSAAAPQADYAEPYRILQQANLALDPSLATSAYASDGKLIFDYPGQQVETFRGHKAIRSSYVRTFGQVDSRTAIGLQFRFEPPGLTSDRQHHLDSRKARIERAGRLFQAIRTGALRVPKIEQIPLERGAEAHRRIEDRTFFGKIVLTA